MYRRNAGGCLINSTTGEKACPTRDIRSAYYKEETKPSNPGPGAPGEGPRTPGSVPSFQPPIAPPHFQPTQPAITTASNYSGPDSNSGSYRGVTNRATTNVVKGALKTFQPAKVTTTEIPTTARQLAELSDFAYAQSDLLERGVDHIDIKDAWNGRIDQSLREYVDELGRPSNDTRTKFGDLDTSLSNETTMIFHNAETNTTRAVMRGAAGEQVKAAKGQLSESYLDRLFEETYFENLGKAAVKYGKVDEAHGYSLGGGAAHRAAAKGLVGEAVSINGFVKDSVLQTGKHTLITQPHDLQHVLNHVLPNAGHNNPQVTKIVVPSLTPQKVGGPIGAFNRMADAHSYEHFLGGGAEGVDPISAQRTAGEMASILKPPSLADDAAAILRQRPTMAGRAARGSKNFAKGAGVNMIGAMVTNEILDVAGVDNEYVSDIAGGVGGAVAESVFLGSSFASAGPVGLAGGIGAAEGAYLANRTGVTGYGKTALEVGGGVGNGALMAVAASQWWNMFGWTAMAIMGGEALAVGIDSALHKNEGEDVRAQLKYTNTSRAQATRDREMAIMDYAKKVGQDPALFHLHTPEQTVEPVAQGGPVVPVRQIQAGGANIQTY